jgi:hypothetical protein
VLVVGNLGAEARTGVGARVDARRCRADASAARDYLGGAQPRRSPCTPTDACALRAARHTRPRTVYVLDLR